MASHSKDFRVAVEIQAPADRVWAVVRDVERWPEWTPSVTSIQLSDHGRFAVGSRVRVRQPGLPPALWRITEVDDQRRSFTWVARSPGVHVTARHSVEAHASGSRAMLSIRYAGLLGPLVARLIGDRNERYLDMEAKGLKGRSEGSQK